MSSVNNPFNISPTTIIVGSGDNVGLGTLAEALINDNVTGGNDLVASAGDGITHLDNAFANFGNANDFTLQFDTGPAVDIGRLELQTPHILEIINKANSGDDYGTIPTADDCPALKILSGSAAATATNEHLTLFHDKTNARVESGKGLVISTSGIDALTIDGSQNLLVTGLTTTAQDIVGAINEVDAAGASSLSAVLAVGNTTGGTNISVSAGDDIIGSTTSDISFPGGGSSSERFGTGTAAGGVNSLAVGNAASAPGASSTAIGETATGTGSSGSTALGSSSSATNGGTALGFNTTVSHAGSIALGHSALTTAIQQMVIGATSSPIVEVVIGKGSTSSSPVLTTLRSTDSQTNTIGGADLTIRAGDGLTTGPGGNLLLSAGDSPTGADGRVSLLSGGTTYTVTATGVGPALTTTAQTIIEAINEVDAAGGASPLSAVLAVGNTTGGTNISVSAGDDIVGSTTSDVTFPGGGSSSERFGAGTAAGGVNSLAVGNAASAPGASAIAIGETASATGPGSGGIALGTSSSAVGGGTALGFNTTVGHANSIALGTGASTTAVGQMVIGSSGPITEVAIGKGSSHASPEATTVRTTDSSTAGTAGADLTIRAGNGLTTGGGGNLLLSAGDSPTGTDGTVSFLSATTTYPLTSGLIGPALTTTAQAIIEAINEIDAAGGGSASPFASWDASAGVAPITDAFATYNTRSGANTAHGILEFDDTANEGSHFRGTMPAGYASGPLSLKIHWTGATATSGDVAWDVSFMRLNTTIDTDSFAAAQTVTTTTSATSGVLATTVISFTQAEADGITAGDPFVFYVVRDAADGGDTMSGDAQLLRVSLEE